LNTQTPGSFNTKGAWLWEAAGLYLSPRMVAGPTADLCPASQYFPTTDRAN
ncbi:5780_t:CDS:1, partial [Paraglomus brasilianum]